MTFKSFEGRVILRVLLLLITLSSPAPVIIRGWAELLVFILPIIIYQVIELIRFLKKAQDELKLFIESIHYRDFSRFFNEKDATKQLKTLRRGYNEINTTFQSINKEKETQHQHLQKMLEMVETGILSYDTKSGNILLMNESVKKMLQTPFMNTIHALEKRNDALYDEIVHLVPGQNKIVNIQASHLEKSNFKVLLTASTFQSEGNKYKLVAFQNINEALDETESQAWQKLLDVLTHEIMNSIAPISSVADTLKNRLHEISLHGVQTHDLEDLEEGISTIKRRSTGLLRFAETYRNLNKITKLNLETVYIREVFANLQRLMQPTLLQKNICLEVLLKDPTISLQADINLLDQVLINLLINAIEAVRNVAEPHITLSAAATSEGKVVIKITDNGTGMPKEVQEKIFIPFFSTRKQGSGIGLSLCKQIVMLHRGTIQVQSVEGEGTAFTLRFG